jgi:GT2 family glycosyltransferase
VNEPVSIAIPALDDTALFERHLPALLAEVERRGGRDEVLVVDDSGGARLADWIANRFPSVRVLTRRENGGFARALADGIAAARHPLVFAMNSDVRVRPGFLEPLAAALDDSRVFAAVPAILLDGREGAVESLVRVELDGSIARLAQPALHGVSAPLNGRVRVPFAVGGAFLVRRDEFRALGGFDPLFEPFYLEDLDLGWRAWRDGREILLEPRAVVEHYHRGTIGPRFGERVARAAIERNLLLFQWKHADGEEVGEHLAALARRAHLAWLTDDRDTLVALALALESAPAALAARSKLGESRRGFREILSASDPLASDQIP